MFHRCTTNPVKYLRWACYSKNSQRIPAFYCFFAKNMPVRKEAISVLKKKKEYHGARLFNHNLEDPKNFQVHFLNIFQGLSFF